MNMRLQPEPSDERDQALAEDYRLCEAVSARDPSAMEEFHERYYRLARFMAQKAARASGIVEPEDLSQEALILMYGSAKAYREGQTQARFARYATSFMLPKLREIESTNQIVGLPAHVSRLLNNIDALNSSRYNHGLASMSDEEIAEELNIPLKGANTVSVQSLMQAKMLTTYMGSIDGGYSPHQPESPGNGYVLDERDAMESVTGKYQPTVEEQVEATLRSEAINEVLSTLQDREANIVRMVLGLDDGTEKTFEAISKIYGISGTRVRTTY